ncbi:hypothetical protein, partial [Pararhodobacter marinus]
DTAQSAWRKIEGRFDTVSLIDDGVDALEMLAEALDGRRDAPDAAAIVRARAAGFFADIADDSRLADILARTAPLTPAALQILPGLAAQVAQAERTMFRYIRGRHIRRRLALPHRLRAHRSLRLRQWRLAVADGHSEPGSGLRRSLTGSHGGGKAL